MLVLIFLKLFSTSSKQHNGDSSLNFVRFLGDQLFWSAAGVEPEPNNNYFDYKYNHRPPADVEMTAYALMSYLRRKESIGDVLKIVKWLSKQRNNYGGFSSTQVCNTRRRESALHGIGEKA
jgi:hypothetical protein